MAERTVITPGPEGLRALSHPGRLRMLGLLRSEGPATATTLALRLGLNTGATSYHLRQLEKHGFVTEDTERGNGRDRWWRARHDTTRLDMVPASPDEHESHDAYLHAVAAVTHHELQRSLDELQLLPEPWQDAADMSDWGLRLTPRRARELVETVHALIDEWGENDGDDDGDAELFRLQLNAFVLPGTVAPAVAEEDDS